MVRLEGETSNLGSRGLPSKRLPPNAQVVGVSRFTLESALVRAEGLEPPRLLSHQDLNLARLPVPPRPHL